MKVNLKGKIPVFVIIIIFSIILLAVFVVDWVDKNITNPRIWKDMTCEEMKEFAMKREHEKLNDFQQSRFLEDLTLCMGSM